jgi:hypothetical protein
VRRWFALAPQVGRDVFIKLYAHGTQEQNSRTLLEGGLHSLFSWVREEAELQECELYFVTAWQMYLALDALRKCTDPVQAVGANLPSLETSK